MQFYWSLKKLPEFHQRTGPECLRVLWRVGLKPFRSWRVWLVIAGISLVGLLVADAALDNLFFSPTEGSAGKTWIEIAVFFVSALLLFNHTYFKNLRPYLGQVTDAEAESGRGALAGGVLIQLSIYILLIVSLLVGMLGFDWVINCFDVSPDTRMAALRSWPEPIPDKDNGFVSMAGMQAAPDADPFEVGRAYVAARNEAVRKHTEPPQWPMELKYVGYAGHNIPTGEHEGNEKPGTPSPYEKFCGNRFESCWDILQNERAATRVWLAENKKMLARYQSLQKYPRWQYAFEVEYMSFMPAYQPLIEGQRLQLASAMLEIEKGQVSQGLGMIGDDIRFTRKILGSKEVLIGKLIGGVLLTRDLALLAETLEARPKEVKPYLAQIEMMLAPLTPDQISLADEFRYEEKIHVSLFERDDFRDKFNLQTLSMSYDGSIPKRTFWEGILDKWLAHGTRRYATANMQIAFWEGAVRSGEVRDVNSTPPLTSSPMLDSLNAGMGWWGFALNNGGKLLFYASLPAYHGYQNRTYDLNALNNLVRLQVKMAEKNVPPAEVRAYLNSSDRSLWNPETGKPFEWDEKRNQIYYVPAEAWVKNKKIGGVEGRIGVAVR